MSELDQDLSKNGQTCKNWSKTVQEPCHAGNLLFLLLHFLSVPTFAYPLLIGGSFGAYLSASTREWYQCEVHECEAKSCRNAFYRPPGGKCAVVLWIGVSELTDVLLNPICSQKCLPKATTLSVRLSLSLSVRVSVSLSVSYSASVCKSVFPSVGEGLDVVGIEESRVEGWWEFVEDENEGC